MATDPITSEKATENAPRSDRASSRGESTELETTAPTDKEKSPEKGIDLAKADSKVIQPKDATEKDDPFQHLPANEAEILRRQVFTPEVKVGIGALYRFASKNDLLIIAASSIAAIASGAALPLMTVIFGNLQGTFQNYGLQLISYDDFMKEMTNLVLYFVYLAIGEFVSVSSLVEIYLAL
jgi:ATP-binding cassette, subfamily B (MDR/TAP), member 1